MLKENIPQLRCLNEVPFSEVVREENSDLSSSEYRSSSSSNDDERRGRWDAGGAGDGAWNERHHRPATSHQERTVTVELLDDARPASAGNWSLIQAMKNLKTEDSLSILLHFIYIR